MLQSNSSGSHDFFQYSSLRRLITSTYMVNQRYANMWKYLTILLVSLLISRSVAAQTFKFDDEISKEAFSSTYWEPKRGVKLLRQEAGIKMWKSFTESCNTSINIEGECFFPEVKEWEHLTSLHVFTTDHLIAFVYTKSSFAYSNPDWAIYEKNSKKLLYKARSFDGGYDADAVPLIGIEGCSDDVFTTTRFRPYVRDGNLLLETHVQLCRREENHHEFLFHLDEETLTEVPGSRFVQDTGYPINNDIWTWRYADDSYSRFGKLSWTSDNERSWTRQLMSIPAHKEFVDFKGALHTQTCFYSNKSRAVECEMSLQRKSEVPLIVKLVEYKKKEWEKNEEIFEKVGLYYSEELKSYINGKE